MIPPSRARTTFRLLILVILLPLVLPTNADAQTSNPYKAETRAWRADANGFVSWQLDGVLRDVAGTRYALRLDTSSARLATDPFRAGAYKGGNFYNGGAFIVGEAASPIITPTFPFSQAIPSWNIDTPAGTWAEIQLRVRKGSTWTSWYNMGVWSSGTETVVRHSVSAQTDAKAYVDVDTLKIGTRSAPSTASAYQLKVRLFSTNQHSVPVLRNAAVAVSTTPVTPIQLTAGNPAHWNKVLPIPECSQMVYPDGGEVWCSPTSVAMVLSYWAGRAGSGSCSVDVRAAVSGVYDRIYKGHGNWPFNTAYAAGGNMEARVTRFTSMAQAEEWIASGVPVIMSVSWGRNQLTGAPIPSSNGHLVVLSGFDASGNPIVNDPAAPTNAVVQRTYKRSDLEKLWLQGSGGTAYLIYPSGRLTPQP